MRRITWMMTSLMLVLALALAGCGKKDAGSLSKDLDQKVSKLESYQGSGKMVLYTGQQPQEYAVDVSYKNPHYYRISLTNEKKDIEQIVLRNDEGVFVLTPHLNKSFRFQSDWPNNQGQVYLYHSLVQSIVADKDRKMTTDGKDVVFDVLANYGNPTLVRQKIWLDSKSYSPRHVEVLDANTNIMVTVDFDTFKFDASFDKDSFDTQRNLTGSLSSMPTVAGTDGKAAGTDAKATGTDAKASGTDAKAAGTDSKATGTDAKATGTDAKASGTDAKATGTDAKATGTDAKSTGTDAKATGTDAKATGTDAKATGTDAKATGTDAKATGTDAKATGTAAPSAAAKTVTAVDPWYLPKGVALKGSSDITLGGNPAVMLRYGGTYNYTLVESKPADKAVAALPGKMVSLGYTLGLLTGDQQKTLTWTYDGMEYRLSSGDLPFDEMVNIAQAVQGDSMK
ncbi:outer membrane lipoprotein carrier protein LolA [Paenibacillus aurantius]|uniref:Outer membrane lipoprotein carrier protein LolA n=1 Tax=Paenibacillus aurantius TaxID=2918900 RepID=A0AA96LE25_9BACL|nr:outer membrane lipoprotein carrier protein LolA [Paenibacillus aurantius]WNQ10415.1 outer membrane lipoprotein carrier protein LolA [Paenibacillus aurantius]